MVEIILEAENFKKAYGSTVILDRVNFKIKKGEIVGLIGENGAGKTTLLKAITGLHGYDGGNLKYEGVEISENPGIVTNFGVLIESKFLNYLSAYDNLKLLLWVDGETDADEIDMKIDEILKLVDLSESKNKKVKYFSYGMMQRLGLAQAILLTHTMMILDEPFLGLDPIGKSIVKNAIKEKSKNNMSILLSSHNLEDIEELCDSIIVIKNGTTSYVGPIIRKKDYIIYAENIQSEKLSKFKEDLTFIDNNKILYQPELENNRLDELLQILIKNDIKINDIEIEMNTLKDFFYKEDKNAISKNRKI